MATAFTDPHRRVLLVGEAAHLFPPFGARGMNSAFADAVAACERASSATPFKWNGGTNTRVIGLNSVKLDKYNIVSSYTLVADGVFCDFDPIKKKANIGSNFLERE